MTVAKPASWPTVPHFSSGPCAKRPGWNPQNLKDAALGRSHRAKIGKTRLKLAIDLTREVLEVPADYRMDPTITNHATYGPLVVDAITNTLPITIRTRPTMETSAAIGAPVDGPRCGGRPLLCTGVACRPRLIR